MLPDDVADYTPSQALNELPSVYQSIGRVAQRLKRVKSDSKLGKELWLIYDELNHRGSMLSAIIRPYVSQRKSNEQEN